MIHLCAFADEISPDLDEQIDVLQAEHITFIELRSIWNTNVLALDDAQLETVQQRLITAGIRVGCIGSPIGKVRVDEARGEVARLERAIEVACKFDTRLIRVFSFYPDLAMGTDDAFTERVIESMAPLIEVARRAEVTLVHENERGIFGDTVAHCRTLFEAFRDQGLVAAFDPANFIQCGQVPYPDAFDALRPWISHIHVKDALPNGTVTVAGEGSAGWPALLERLRAEGYNGLLSLEPHLFQEGKLGGFSGVDRFRQASQVLQLLLQRMHWPYG